MRTARLQAGYTQTALGDAVGVAYQQIQKYERGANRISLSRASQFASILRISVATLFDDPDAVVSQASPPHAPLAQWMELYARACNTKSLSEIVEVAEEIIGMRESTTLARRRRW
ncbi:hypothetical protein RHECNPAF_258003 [Rhizobium etli CNPAF512]|nr:hypothetical protein RHECNPAF_258003 [Rhizobium etli CNPAF512]